MLARPLRRSSYLLGRWLGLALVIVVYAIASGLLAIGAVGFVSGYLPPDPLLPLLYLAGQALVLLSLTVLLSDATAADRRRRDRGRRLRTGLDGRRARQGRGGDRHERVSSAISDASRFLLPTDALWQGVVYGLEPSFVINQAGGEFVARSSPFFTTTPPPPILVAWAGIWIVLVLALAVSQLRRREL